MKTKTTIALCLLAWFLGFKQLKAQQANPNCVPAPTLTSGSYTNLVTQSQVGWFKYTTTNINEEITITNSNNNSQLKIEKVEFYSGLCNNLSLLATDSITDVSDSTLNFSVANLSNTQVYKIKIYRKATEQIPFQFSFESTAPQECGFYYGYSPLTITTNTFNANQTGNWAYYGFNGGCLINNSTGAPSTSHPNSNTCTLSVISCQPLYLGYTGAGSYNGVSGNFCLPNTIFYVFSNVPNSTFTVSSGPQATVALNFNVSGATQYTIVANSNCLPIPLTQTLTIDDLTGCSCLPIVVNVTNLSCDINVPNPLCVGQQFCIGPPLPPLPPNPSNGTYYYFPNANAAYQIVNSNNNITYTNCLPNGLSAGTYTIKVIKGYYFNDGNTGETTTLCACSNSQVITVLPNSTTPTVTASPVNGCIGQITALTANNGLPNQTYTWQPGNIVSTQPILVPFPNGTQIYTVTAGNGCSNSGENYIEITGVECCVLPTKANPFYFNNVTLVPFGTGNATPWANLTPNSTYAGINIAVPNNTPITNNMVVTGFLNVNANNLTFLNSGFLFSDAATMVQNGSNLTIDRCYLRGCKNWQGITSTSNINITNSVIEDAQYAIKNSSGINPHAGINIQNVLFNNNYCALRIANRNVSNLVFRGNLVTCRVMPFNYNLNSTTPWQYQTGLFDLASLQNYPTANLKGSNALGLLNTQRGQFGIEMVNAGRPSNNQNLQIGDFTNGNATNQTNYRNVFDNLRIGVNASGSRLGVYNSVFNQLRYLGFVFDNNTTTAGVYISNTRCNVGFNTTGNNNNVAIYTNTFATSQTGFFATAQSTFNVSNNKFNDLSFANQVLVNNNSNLTTVNYITNNTMHLCRLDLNAYDNRRINLRFENNTSTFAQGNKPQFEYNVYLAEINTPTTALYYINSNTFTDKHIGIYGANTYSTVVQDNVITLVKPIFGAQYANIWIQGGSDWTVRNNIAKVAPSNSGGLNSIGILTENSSNNLYCENIITGSGACMKFQGPCPSKIYRNKLNVNPTDPCQIGIFLDNSGQVGDIAYPINGSQATADNEFGDFSLSDTYVQTNSIGDKIHYQGLGWAGNIYFPLLNLNSTTSQGLVSFSTINNNYSGVSTCDIFNQQQAQKISKGIPPFVSGVVNFNGNTTNANTIAKKQVYHLFKNGYANANTIAGYNNFMATNNSNNIGKYFKADSLVNEFALSGNSSNITQANAFNNSATPNGVVEQNQQVFNTIYFNYLNNPASVLQSQLNTLISIAQLCPFTDGNAVYQSRALLRYYNDSTYYSNVCEFNLPNNGGSRFSINSATDFNTTKEALFTKVFPNPASTEVTITTVLTNATIIIYNIVGQEILNMPLTSQTQLNVSELKNGTYLYKILAEGKLVKTDKLIINK